MVRFFADPSQVSGQEIILTGPDVNHMKNVLRMHPGDDVSVSAGTGISYACKIAGFTEDTAVLDILSETPSANELEAEITLFQGLPKSDKLELIIQKAVELGAARIVPVQMKRCIVKWDVKKEENHLKRYRAIAEAAAKQSKRDVIPEVSGIMKYKDALTWAEENCDIILVPYEDAEGMEKTRRVIGSLEKGKRIAVFIGPEGGFEPDEVKEASEKGAEIITLGNRILRTETAGLTALSILMYTLQ